VKSFPIKLQKVYFYRNLITQRRRERREKAIIFAPDFNLFCLSLRFEYFALKSK